MSASSTTILHALCADYVTHIVSTYLDCLSFWRLRQTCKSFAPLIKPPPSFKYKLVVATITDGRNEAHVLVAETLAHAMEALHAMYDANYETYTAKDGYSEVTLHFVNFVVDDDDDPPKKQPRTLLAHWPCSLYYEMWEFPSCADFSTICDVVDCGNLRFGTHLFARSPDGEETRNGCPSENLMALLLWLNSTTTFASNCESGHLQHVYFQESTSEDETEVFYDLEGEGRRGATVKKNSVYDGTIWFEHQAGSVEKWRTTDTISLWDTF